VRKPLRIAIIVYTVYLAVCLLVISPALNILPQRYMQDTYDWELRTGWVLLNPFKVSLDISDAQLNDAEGQPFLAFGEATVNLSLASLWRKGWVLDAVRLRDIHVTVTQFSDGEYNFSDLLPADTAEEPAEPDSGEIPGITIGDLELQAETIILNDQARKTPYSSRWNGLHIRVNDLSTVAEEGRPYIVDLKGDGGGVLHWEGEVSLPKASSTGQLSISNLNLRKVWQLAEPWVHFELKDGRLAIEGEYQLDWSDAFSYHVSDGHIGFSVIDIAPKVPDELPDTAVTLQALDLNNITLDSATQQVNIGALILDSLALSSWMEDSQVSLQELFAPSPPANAAPVEEKEEKDNDGGDWSVTLDRAQLLNGSLHWRSAFTEPSVLAIQPVEAAIENFSWPLSGETELSLKLSANQESNIELGGTLALGEGAGSINYTLDGLPLSWFNPNLPTAFKAAITGGIAAVKGEVTLRDFTPTTIALAGEIQDFSARREGAEVTLTGWDSVRFEDLSVDMDQHNMVLGKLAIDSYTGRIHIQKDGSINASNVWKEEVGEQTEEIAEDLTGDKPWSFSLPVITITDSEIDFMDESLPLQFRTVIGDLAGEILNIDSAADSNATVELKGSVDSYAPVALTGQFSAFATPPALDLNLTFNSIDMALLSPYSGTYVGYVIDQGLLDVELQYALQENQLQGQNSIRIDKLKLGDKVSSDKALDLPLELALAIMTNADGIIDMKVPVAGNVTDPEFKLGGVISQALLNIITKAITAPFTLLAGLVDSEEDLQRITVTPGYSDLSEENRKKLDDVVSALDQRPNLSLIITGKLNLTADRERMQKNALKAQLLNDGLSVADIEDKGPKWEKAITEYYEDLPLAGPETEEKSIREQYLKVTESFTITDSQLTDLAEQRAVTAKSYLVNEAGLAPDRAVVGQPDLEENDNTFSGVELGIEN
jgi:hypothetical protein